MTEIPKDKKKAFPFDVDIEMPSGLIKGSVLVINAVGMIVEVPSSAFIAQMPVKTKWILPVYNTPMAEEGLVVKTSSQHFGDRIVYKIEIHFKKPKKETIEGITNLNTRVEVIRTKTFKKPQ